VKNVPIYFNEQNLSQLFVRFGPIRSLKIKRPQVEQTPFFATAAYAIAYINFEKEEDAARAIKEMNGYNVNGNTLQVEIYDKS
jgi:RNA recognition motif-containing protein